MPRPSSQWRGNALSHQGELCTWRLSKYLGILYTLTSTCADPPVILKEDPLEEAALPLGFTQGNRVEGRDPGSTRRPAQDNARALASPSEPPGAPSQVPVVRALVPSANTCHASPWVRRQQRHRSNVRAAKEKRVPCQAEFWGVRSDIRR